MKKRKVRFSYEKLRSMDMVCCAGRSPFALVTRLVTAGWKHKLNHEISVHTGIIFPVEGQFLVAEMQAKGLQLNSLERYSKVGGRRWVISIRRNVAFDSVVTRCDVQRQIALDLRHQLEYDPKGLLEFVFERVEDDKERLYCSEYVYQISKSAGVKYPAGFRKSVSPYDLQVCASGWNNVHGCMRVVPS